MNDDELIGILKTIIDETKNIPYKQDGLRDKVQKRLEMLIRNKFGDHSHYLDDLLDTNFSKYPFDWGGAEFLSRDTAAWEEAKQNWINLIETMIEEIQSFPSEKKVTQIIAAQKIRSNQNRLIFIVHGHDNEMVQNVARVIEKIGFKPIILREQPNKGRTIIEKFENYSDVPFAIVLFSPDDLGKAVNEKDLNPRPRQNVVFELGFFIGKLGRENVVVLHREVPNFEMLSDFKGVLFEPYKDGWDLKIAKEMKASGLSVDLNTLA
jgi:predicted nucleotide-binding protein